MNHVAQQTDKLLDLSFERIVHLSPDQIWQAWTTPSHLMRWFTPEPWKTIECDIDLRPGGAFHTVMQSPEGENFPHQGCYLEIVPNRKLVWTNALAPGFRPVQPSTTTPCDMFFFTAILTLEPQGNATKYAARVIHGNEADREKHRAMGFEEGWNKALDQLIATFPST